MPGYRFQYHVPPKSAPFSMIRKLATPARRSSTAVSSPAMPPPTIRTSTDSVDGSRLAGTLMWGSREKSAKAPSTAMYCALPFGLSRLLRSSRYFSASRRLRSTSIAELSTLLDKCVLLGDVLDWPSRIRTVDVNIGREILDETASLTCTRS